MLASGHPRRAEVPGALHGNPPPRTNARAERPVGAVAAPDRAPARTGQGAGPGEIPGQPVLPRGAGPLPDRFPTGLSRRRAMAGAGRGRDDLGAGERPEPHLEPVRSIAAGLEATLAERRRHRASVSATAIGTGHRSG